jgi:hypothetical protein
VPVDQFRPSTIPQGLLDCGERSRLRRTCPHDGDGGRVSASK